MKLRQSQTGFSAVEGLLIVAVVAVLGFVGYKVYSGQQDKPASTGNNQTADQSAKADDVPEAPEIKETNDLDKANATLDQVNPDDDTGELDSQLSSF